IAPPFLFGPHPDVFQVNRPKLPRNPVRIADRLSARTESAQGLADLFSGMTLAILRDTVRHGRSSGEDRPLAPDNLRVLRRRSLDRSTRRVQRPVVDRLTHEESGPGLCYEHPSKALGIRRHPEARPHRDL